MANRLANATSPYLQQHSGNPVDWWEWGPEAFEEARRRDTPILLSVGYAACHWCHVMAHESFEDAAVARVMNERFVCVKVDREERPDVDATYMAAVQAMTGRGGWPMTVFLTPEGRAFQAGTYYPSSPRHGMPSFVQVLAAVSQAWQQRRDQVEAVGSEVTRRLASLSVPTPSHVGGPPDEALTTEAVASLRQDWDEVSGGFGGAPKFPPSMVLDFLLRHHHRTDSQDALAMVQSCCEAMARGGIYDQLAGGFARYSVDSAWVVPHFEKMLTDNALLLPVYLDLWRTTGSPTARRVVVETAEFMLCDLRTPDGGFASSLDADAVVDGSSVEGATYVWTPQELAEVLGESAGAWAADLLRVTPSGTFEHGRSTLQLPTDPSDPARWLAARRALRSARDERPQPTRDDKVVTAWNAMAAAALADAGTTMGVPAWVDAAEECGRLLLEAHVDHDLQVARASRSGRVSAPGVLEDYAWLVTACQALFSATGGVDWFRRAESLLAVITTRFGDGHGGYYDTAVDATDPRLGRRPRDPLDGASPSGQFVLAGALLTHAAYTGSAAHREQAAAALAPVLSLGGGSPRAVGRGLAVVETMLAGPLEIVVVGESDENADGVLSRVAYRTPSAGRVIAVDEAPSGPVSRAEHPVPLMAGRVPLAGRPTAYVCRGFVCDLPVTDPSDLARLIRQERH